MKWLLCVNPWSFWLLRLLMYLSVSLLSSCFVFVFVGYFCFVIVVVVAGFFSGFSAPFQSDTLLENYCFCTVCKHSMVWHWQTANTQDTIQTQFLFPQSPYRYAVIALLWLFSVFHSKNGHIFNSRSSLNNFNFSFHVFVHFILFYLFFLSVEKRKTELAIVLVINVKRRMYLLRTRPFLWFLFIFCFLIRLI